MKKSPVVLIVLDGVGYNENPKGNAVLAETPEEVIACLVAGKQPRARSSSRLAVSFYYGNHVVNSWKK